jgi:hypothetical protein
MYKKLLVDARRPRLSTLLFVFGGLVILATGTQGADKRNWHPRILVIC